MDVKVYNYIDYSLVTNQTENATAPASNSSSEAENNATFAEALSVAQRATAALTIDATLLALQQAGNAGISLDSHLAYELGIISTDPDTRPASTTSATTSSTYPGQANVERSENYTTKCPGHSGTSGYNNTGTLKCSDELQSYFEAAAEATGVDVKLIKSVAFAESSFRTNLVCSNGATGVMMLMPIAQEAYGVENALDPYENILAGARILADKLEEFNGDLSLAVAAYNAGSGAVKKYGGIPPYTETQNYVVKVTNFYNS